MSDDPVTEARALLAAATPGPWRWWTSNSFRRLSTDADGKDGGVAYATVHPIDRHPDIVIREPDMALIAAAPRLLAALVERCERAEADVHRLRDVLGWSEANCPGRCRGVIGEVLAGQESPVRRAERAEAEVARLRAALEKYGEHAHDPGRDWCATNDDFEAGCDCGLDAALAGPGAPVEAAVCGKPCDHGSPCLLLAGHVPAARHETQHGCVFYEAPAKEGA